MLNRADFIFTIGYDGPSAVIDGHAQKKYSKLSTKELAEKGLFRAACASAIYPFDRADNELDLVAEVYNRTAPKPVQASQLLRLFGVHPTDVSRTVVL